jgi:hypothetical protein
MLASLPRWAAVGLLATLLCGSSTPGQEKSVPPFDRNAPPGKPPAVPDDEPEIDARGPIHEGFAQPSNSPAKAGPTAPKLPPKLVNERPPSVRPEGSVWVPGYWFYDEDRKDFLWVSGFWRVPPAGRKWVPGYWARTDDGARWVSGYWADGNLTGPAYLDPPPTTLELGPSVPAPAVGYLYVPGIWIPVEGDWAWRPGFWNAPRAGLVYTPARYLWTPRGYVYSSGFWDQPWDRRGVLSPPVYFGANTSWTRPGWFYQSRFAVNLEPALGALWARPTWGHYAFGDYYAATYAHRGYLPWATYGLRARDPLFGYASYANRANPAWQRALVTTYENRIAGRATPPPRTLAAQRRAKVDDPLVVPLDRYKGDGVRLATLSALEQGTAVRRAATLLLDGDVRRATESRVMRPPSSGRVVPLPSTATLPPPATTTPSVRATTAAGRPMILSPSRGTVAPRLTTPPRFTLPRTTTFPPPRTSALPPARATTPLPRATTRPPARVAPSRSVAPPRR